MTIESAGPWTAAPAVVVGVDGSAGAREALRWALAEARLRQAPVRAIHAWTYGFVGGDVDGYPGWDGSLRSYTSLGVDVSELRRAAEGLLEREVASVGGDDGLVVEREVVQGTAGDVLVRAVGPDDLLVVGSRGHGGFGGLLTGSVSQQCVHHARCPVVVVHAPSPDAAGRKARATARTEAAAAA